MIATAVLLVITPRLAVFYKIPELDVLLPLLAVFVATDGLATTGRAVLFSLQRFEWVSGLSLIFNLGKTLLVAWLWWSHEGPAGARARLLAAHRRAGARDARGVALGAPRKARAASTESGPPEPNLVQSIFRYCLPLYGARLSFLSGQNLGKLVLGTVLDATQLGYFSFAFQTVERFVELVHTIPTALLPAFTQIVAKDEGKAALRRGPGVPARAAARVHAVVRAVRLRARARAHRRQPAVRARDPAAPRDRARAHRAPRSSRSPCCSRRRGVRDSSSRSRS